MQLHSDLMLQSNGEANKWKNDGEVVSQRNRNEKDGAKKKGKCVAVEVGKNGVSGGTKALARTNEKERGEKGQW